MNRSWPNMNAASKLELNHREGKSRNIPGKTSNFDKHFAKVGEDESQHSRDVPDEEQYPYDTVKTSSLEAMHALKILPAKPIKESEYADQRYLGNAATTQISRNTKSSIIIQPKSSDSPRDLGQCTYLSEERRVPNVKGEKEKVIGSQHPLPPPRPLKTLPKKYQPLPPEPERSNQLSQTRKICSQAHTFPMSAKNTRHLELNEAPGKGRDISREAELSFQTRQQKTKYHPASR
ncbi:cytokine-dependent hematopoietic cell linker [Dermochelys coriacea]|uniref:cytokine-dependent hematopoietic cell linker n=1 Tax=Dermochelys coriacea TaxID=27794 RepID=UPI001CA94B58|nr:cytokine-dependent hematopoietic cell linker [Dermochelys coriacea]